MQIPKYLSPSQLALWERDKEEYYLTHCTEIRAPKLLQTLPMGLGSSVDAYIKSTMHEVIFGKNTDPKFEFEVLFENQVEPQNRTWALEHGKYVFECYKLSGSYNELLTMILDSTCAPQFEATINSVVEGIPLLGRPDLRFMHKNGAHIILDFKVNGYCSKAATSPAKNYRLCRDGWIEGKHTPGNDQPHKNYRPVIYKGVEIGAHFLEDSNEDWADQLSIYAWILGEKIGDESVIFCIDQLVGKPTSTKTLVRVANHRARISRMYQQVLIGRVHQMWSCITSGHIFKDLSKEENDERCKILEQEAIMMQNNNYFNDIARSVRSFK